MVIVYQETELQLFCFVLWCNREFLQRIWVFLSFSSYIYIFEVNEQYHVMADGKSNNLLDQWVGREISNSVCGLPDIVQGRNELWFIENIVCVLHISGPNKSIMIEEWVGHQKLSTSFFDTKTTLTHIYYCKSIHTFTTYWYEPLMYVCLHNRWAWYLITNLSRISHLQFPCTFRILQNIPSIFKKNRKHQIYLCRFLLATLNVSLFVSQHSSKKIEVSICIASLG